MTLELADKYILAIVKEGSISAAARSLNVSQPAISLALSQLEKRLEFEIFQRKTSPLKPTKAGNIYIEYVKSQCELIDDCFQKINDLDNSKPSTIRLGGSTAYTESILVPAIIKFHQNNPNHIIKVCTAYQSELMQMTVNGELDGFVSTSEDLSYPLKTVFLKREKLFLCHSKLTNSESETCTADKMDMIFMEPDQPLQQTIRSYIQECDLNITSHITVNQVSTALRLMEGGNCSAILSEDACRLIFDHDSVVMKPLPKKYNNRALYFAYNDSRYFSKSMKEIIKYCKGE